MSLQLACPAAAPVHPPSHGPSVLCGALEIANSGAHIDGNAARGQVSALMSGRQDPSVVQNFCAGRGVPGSPASYCRCAIWRAEKQRIAAGRTPGADGLKDTKAGRVQHSPTGVNPDQLTDALDQLAASN